MLRVYKSTARCRQNVIMYSSIGQQTVAFRGFILHRRVTCATSYSTWSFVWARKLHHDSFVCWKLCKVILKDFPLSSRLVCSRVWCWCICEQKEYFSHTFTCWKPCVDEGKLESSIKTFMVACELHTLHYAHVINVTIIMFNALKTYTRTQWDW